MWAVKLGFWLTRRRRPSTPGDKVEVLVFSTFVGLDLPLGPVERNSMKRIANFTSNINRTVVIYYPAVPRLEEDTTVYEKVIGTLRDVIYQSGVFITVKGTLQFHPWSHIAKLEFP